MFVFNQQELISRESNALTTSVFPGGRLKNIVIHLEQRSRVECKAFGYFALEQLRDMRLKTCLTGVK